MTIKAMKQALEALEQIADELFSPFNDPPIRDAILALRTAIEQAKKQEPNEDYERGFVDGMQEQMKTSVDRAVNAMCKREWVGLTEIEICDIEADELTSASSETFSFARAIEAKLKEKNT